MFYIIYFLVDTQKIVNKFSFLYRYTHFKTNTSCVKEVGKEAIATAMIAILWRW